MLDSRYIHLHEALGLGAMWLKQGAKIIGQPEHTLPVATPKTTPTPITKPTAEQRNMHPSRLAVLQKINSATLQPTTTAPPLASTTRLSHLLNRILHQPTFRQHSQSQTDDLKRLRIACRCGGWKTL